MNEKTCPNCKIKFEPKTKRQNYCYEQKTHKCKFCNKEITYKCTKTNGNKPFCDKTCYYADKKTSHKKCIICGDPAIDKYCNHLFEKECLTCNKMFKYKHSQQIKSYCSVICANKNKDLLKKKMKTQIKKYGALGFNTEKQKKKTMVDRYGYETPAKNEEIKEKIRKTQHKRNNGKFAFNTENKKPFKMNINRISKINRNYAKKIKDKYLKNISFETPFLNKFVDLSVNENLFIDINPTISHNNTYSYLSLIGRRKDDEVGLVKEHHSKRASLFEEQKTFYVQKFDWVDEDRFIQYLGSLFNKEININNKLNFYFDSLYKPLDILFLKNFYQGSYILTDSNNLHLGSVPIYKINNKIYFSQIDSTCSFDMSSLLTICDKLKEKTEGCVLNRNYLDKFYYLLNDNSPVHELSVEQTVTNKEVIVYSAGYKIINF